MVRRLGASAAAVALRLKDLAPYAVIALVVPGGALMTLLLWLYRRQQGRRVFPDSLIDRTHRRGAGGLAGRFPSPVGSSKN
jgi:hypothetical protein